MNNPVTRKAILPRASTQTALNEFCKSVDGIKLAVLTSSDGFEVASYNLEKVLSAKLCAMSSSLQALAQTTVSEVGLTKSKSVMIETDDGVVLIIGVQRIQPQLSLAVVATNDALMGQILWSAKRFCSSLHQLAEEK